MTACAIEPRTAPEDGVPRAGCTITADGAYAARLTLDGDCWFPERWTLDGPEPYAVPLPGNQPEEPGTEVQPMGDGRVLIRRTTEGRHVFSLLYPTGPGTGEVLIGAVECPDEGTRLSLLPPAPCGEKAYALAVGRRSSTLWLVAGGAFGPEHLTEIPGRCSGGVWLDHSGRVLALDRGGGGRTKRIVVDLGRGGGGLPPRPSAARHSCSGVNGAPTTTPPNAAVTALATAAGPPIVPASPMPLAPSGFRGVGVSTNAVRSSGASAAVSSR